MTATQHVARLSKWLEGEPARGRTYAHAYSTVQHAGNVLPRVYLLAAAAAARARAGPEEGVDAAALLADVGDTARGIQHPLRGLFLRAHLLTALRDALPKDAVSAADFVLTNFGDANRLWVRMGVHGRARATATAAARTQLADLVGKHVTLLSSLDGMDASLYASTVLPRLLDAIVACRDGLAQHYLTQAVVAAFPASFHAATLPTLLAALPDLQPDARVAAVFGALLDRLAAAAVGEGGDADAEADSATAAALRGDATYAALKVAAGAVAARPDTPAADVGALFGALARFGGATGGAAAGATRADAALAAAADAVAARGGVGGDVDAAATTDGADALVGLLRGRLAARGAAACVLSHGFTRLAAALPPPARRDAAAAVAAAAADGDADVGDAGTVAALLSFVAPLAASGGDGGDDAAATMDADAATLLARVVHRLRSDDVDAHYAALGAAHTALAASAPPSSAPRLLPPLAFSAVSVAARCLTAGAVGGGEGGAPPPAEPGAGPATAAGALQFAGRVAAAVADADPALGLGLHTAVACVAGDHAALEPVAYDAYEQAFALFEEGLPDSAAERAALGTLAGALARASSLAPDSRDALAHKLGACAGRLLRRADQCRALLAAARVHWQPERKAGDGDASAPPSRDGKKALTCLQRALKAAAAASTQAAAARRGGRAAAGAAAEAAALHVDVVNAYLDLVADGCAAIKPADVTALAKLAGREVGEAGDPGVERYWDSTRARVGGGRGGRGGEAGRAQAVVECCGGYVRLIEGACKNAGPGPPSLRGPASAGLELHTSKNARLSKTQQKPKHVVPPPHNTSIHAGTAPIARFTLTL